MARLSYPIPGQRAEKAAEQERKASDARVEAVWRGQPIERDRAASSTVEALALQLRAGFHALRKESAQRRLSELDERQAHDMAKRLSRERNGAPPWSETEITAFLELWKANR